MILPGHPGLRRVAARLPASTQVPAAAWRETLAGRDSPRSPACSSSTALGTLWALPAGLAIGLSPKLSRIVQPIVQVAASFPAPMLFPLVIAVLSMAGVSLNFGTIVLMLLGTQWYILFNVIAGAMAIPADLRETARSYRLSLAERVKILYVPAVFPYLVTGWVTAAGGAWNASIVAEYVTFKGQILETRGLGRQISEATLHGDFALLAASVLVMAVDGRHLQSHRLASPLPPGRTAILPEQMIPKLR